MFVTPNGLEITINPTIDGIELFFEEQQSVTESTNGYVTTLRVLVNDETSSTSTEISPRLFQRSTQGNVLLEISGEIFSSTYGIVQINRGQLTLDGVDLLEREERDEFNSTDTDELVLGNLTLEVGVTFANNRQSPVALLNGTFTANLTGISYSQQNSLLDALAFGEMNNNGGFLLIPAEGEIGSSQFNSIVGGVGFAGRIETRESQLDNAELEDNTIEFSFVAAIENEIFSANNSPERIVTTSYEVINNEVRFSRIGENAPFLTYRLLTEEEAIAERERILDIAGIQLQEFTYGSNRGGPFSGEIFRVGSSPNPEQFYIFHLLDNGKPVFLAEQQNGLVLFLFQQGTFFAANGTPPADGFLDNPPVEITSYSNQMQGFNRRPIFRCIENRLVINDRFILSPNGGTLGRTLLDPGIDCQFALTDPSIKLDSIFSIDQSGPANGVFSTSIRQDFSGIDLNDPETELATFGDVAVDEDGNLTGNLSLRLSFAGRRFETDARSFNVFDDLTTEPVIITNQDGVVLTLAREADGDLSGTLTLGAEELATITENGSGIITVNFSDGSFVSII